MEGKNGHIVGFLSLEDFTADVIPNDDDGLVRVQPIRRATGGKPEHSRIQWIILVTALTCEGVAMTSVMTNQRWEIFKEDDTVREENAEAAATLIEEYLGELGFITAPGVYDPQTVMDNIVMGRCALWRYEEDGRLVKVEY